MRFSDGKTEHFARIFTRFIDLPAVPNILVVGCGSGEEAAILGQVFGAHVTGIDPADRFNAEVRSLPYLTLLAQDATALPWDTGTFHLVYSYHTLEHIPAYRRALLEMARVLAPGGGAVIGTPNSQRLAGYLGSKSGGSWRNKLAANLVDWQYRLRGRFRNEFGAHAGFSARRLGAAMAGSFSPVRNITLDYYRAVYPGRKSLITALTRTGLNKRFFPSVYFLGLKRQPAGGSASSP